MGKQRYSEISHFFCDVSQGQMIPFNSKTTIIRKNSKINEFDGSQDFLESLE